MTVNMCGFDKTAKFTLIKEGKGMASCVLMTQSSQPKWEIDEEAAVLLKLQWLPVRWRNALISAGLLKCRIRCTILLPLNPGTHALGATESGL